MNDQDIRNRYFELLKDALTFSLWPEPPLPILARNSGRPFIKRNSIRLISWILAKFGLILATEKQPLFSHRNEGRTWPGFADTMIGRLRLDNLHQCMNSVLEDGVKGDFIETGVWRGGACIFMRGFLAAHALGDRKVFVADSFEGLPRPELWGFDEDQDDRHFTHKFLAVSQGEVERNFRRYHLLDEQVVFIKGWFHESLPQSPVRELSILRIDGDMYGSTLDALENLYDRLQCGGFCIVDDYALEGCRKAVDYFRSKHNIQSPLVSVDWTGIYWRKV
jgi:O-methyltransferase